MLKSFSPVSITAPLKTPDPSVPVIIFDCPHAGRAFPDGFPQPPIICRFDEHEYWDPGAAKILHHLRGQFHQAWFIESTTSRLLADHNRAVATCVKDGFYSDADKKRIIEEIHRPYTDAVYLAINDTLANGRFPILFNVHTYNPVDPGDKSKKRKLFSVGGDADSVIVDRLYYHLGEQLKDEGNIYALKALGLSKDEFLHELNEPFDFNSAEMLEINMATYYSRHDGHPWVHWETNHKYVDQDVVLRIIAAVYDATLKDSKVIADWKKRGDCYFEYGPDRIMRPTMPGWMHQSESFAL